MNRVIVITGTSSGIGEALVLEVAKRFPDSTIVGIGRHNSKKLKTTTKYYYYNADLSDLECINGLFKTIVSKFGRIDVLINNAGSAIKGTIEDVSLDEACKQFDINFWSAVCCMKCVIPQMKTQDTGQIINISSLGSIVSTPTLGFYASAKSALNIVSEVVREESRNDKIFVSLVFPGAVKTNFGKNITIVENAHSTKMRSVYESWDKRFRKFFTNAISSEVAAKKIVDLLDKHKDILFLTFRDKLIVTLKVVLPLWLFRMVLLKFFFKER